MTELSTRASARRLLGRASPWNPRALLLSFGCLALSLAIAYLPAYEGLSGEGVSALFILTLCAGLWVTEAMPAFAVSLLGIGLAITLLGDVSNPDSDWQKYLATWGSPLIWLFLGGFILAAAAQRTGLDRWMASVVLRNLGQRPAVVLLGVMAATAVLSMFISNTATAALMVAVLGPMLAAPADEDRFPRGMLLGIACAANLGGMGTIIGTPPNAIAVGALSGASEINFVRWMVYGVPPAMVLLAILWGALVARYLGRQGFQESDRLSLNFGEARADQSPLRLALVVATFFVTVGMWMASPLHGVPTPVVSVIPICVLTATGVLDASDIRGISWDVLLLIAGGLSLGVAIADSGLADWFVGQIPLEGLGPATIALAAGYLAILMSNLMSNTAAANILLPILVALFGKEDAHLVVPIALSASAAMCLPISTPPNAIVFGTNRLGSSDLLFTGVVAGVITPPVVVGWTLVVRAAERLGSGG